MNMKYQISSGKVESAVKILFYGTEGIGKSSWASKLPEPLFIDVEDSTKQLAVNRLPKPSSYEMLVDEINDVIKNPSCCKTLVIDTFDWAEQMINDSVCKKYGKKGIEEFGYGNGYVYAKEEVARFLELLNRVVAVGINVVALLHAKIVKFELPEEQGSFDMWTLKLGQKTGSQTTPLVKEWADMVLFANYKTDVVATDDKGQKHKAMGNKRVIYTTSSAVWSAKNRFDLPDMIPFAKDFDFGLIAHCFPSWNFAPVQQGFANANSGQARKPVPTVDGLDVNAGGTDVNGQPVAPVQPQVQQPVMQPVAQQTVQQPVMQQQPVQQTEPQVQQPVQAKTEPIQQPATALGKLQDLMQANGITDADIQKAVFMRGYYPVSTPIASYDPRFVEGVLVSDWQNVLNFIKSSVN